MIKRGLQNFKSKNKEQEKLCIEAVVQRRSVKRLFLEISQNSQENTCTRDDNMNKSNRLETLGKMAVYGKFHKIITKATMVGRVLI